LEIIIDCAKLIKPKVFCKGVKTMKRAAFLILLLSFALGGCSTNTTKTTILTIPLTPSCSVPGGTYENYQNVTIQSPHADAAIFYTTDGTDPISSDTKILYTKALNISRDTTLKAVALKNGSVSEIVSATYIILKVAPMAFDIASGAYLGAQTVHIATYPGNASIYYTLDGTDPLNSSTRQLYTDSLDVTDSVKIKAAGILNNYASSETADVTYYIFKQVAWGDYNGTIQYVKQYNNNFYILTFNPDYEDTGRSWVYKLVAGKWQEQTSIPAFWGKRLDFGSDTIYYISGIQHDNKSYVFRYNGTSTDQLGDGFDKTVQIAAFNNNIYLSYQEGMTIGNDKIFKYNDSTSQWDDINKNYYIQYSFISNGYLYFSNNSGIYKMDAGENVSCLSTGYQGIPFMAYNLNAAEGQLKFISFYGSSNMTSGIFIISGSDQIYLNFIIPALASFDAYLDFCYSSPYYYLISTKSLYLMKNRNTSLTVTFNQSGTVFSQSAIYDGNVYYLIGGYLYSLKFDFAGGELQ